MACRDRAGRVVRTEEPLGIRHRLAVSLHPQTNGLLERFHQTLQRDLDLVPYDVSRGLEVAIGRFVEFYDNRRWHKGLNDITRADVLAGRRIEMPGD